MNFSLHVNMASVDKASYIILRWKYIIITLTFTF